MASMCCLSINYCCHNIVLLLTYDLHLLFLEFAAQRSRIEKSGMRKKKKIGEFHERIGNEPSLAVFEQKKINVMFFWSIHQSLFTDKPR